MSKFNNYRSNNLSAADRHIYDKIKDIYAGEIRNNNLILNLISNNMQKLTTYINLINIDKPETIQMIKDSKIENNHFNNIIQNLIFAKDNYIKLEHYIEKLLIKINENIENFPHIQSKYHDFFLKPITKIKGIYNAITIKYNYYMSQIKILGDRKNIVHKHFIKNFNKYKHNLIQLLIDECKIFFENIVKNNINGEPHIKRLREVFKDFIKSISHISIEKNNFNNQKTRKILNNYISEYSTEKIKKKFINIKDEIVKKHKNLIIKAQKGINEIKNTKNKISTYTSVGRLNNALNQMSQNIIVTKQIITKIEKININNEEPEEEEEEVEEEVEEEEEGEEKEENTGQHSSMEFIVGNKHPTKRRKNLLMRNRKEEKPVIKEGEKAGQLKKEKEFKEGNKFISEKGLYIITIITYSNFINNNVKNKLKPFIKEYNIIDSSIKYNDIYNTINYFTKVENISTKSIEYRTFSQEYLNKLKLLNSSNQGNTTSRVGNNLSKRESSTNTQIENKDTTVSKLQKFNVGNKIVYTTATQKKYKGNIKSISSKKNYYNVIFPGNKKTYENKANQLKKKKDYYDSNILNTEEENDQKSLNEYIQKKINNNINIKENDTFEFRFNGIVYTINIYNKDNPLFSEYKNKDNYNYIIKYPDELPLIYYYKLISESELNELKFFLQKTQIKNIGKNENLQRKEEEDQIIRQTIQEEIKKMKKKKKKKKKNKKSNKPKKYS